MKQRKEGFKGNKADLPSKLCQTCARTMTWRKAWAKNWAEVKYCSDACRQNKSNPKKISTTSNAFEK